MYIRSILMFLIKFHNLNLIPLKRSPDITPRLFFFHILVICTIILYSWHWSGSKSIYSPVYNNLSLASGVKNRILNGFFFYQTAVTSSATNLSVVVSASTCAEKQESDAFVCSSVASVVATIWLSEI